MDISVVLTSAAVATVVSSLFTFVSQAFERRMRRKELLFKTATELAVKYTDFSLETLKGSGRKAEFPPYAWLIYEFHR